MPLFEYRVIFENEFTNSTVSSCYHESSARKINVVKRFKIFERSFIAFLCILFETSGVPDNFSVECHFPNIW